MAKRKIVVLGGSFNPPTIAHAQLLTNAVDVLGAESGIFVPSSDKYVSRKMSRQRQCNQVYSESERADMLRELCRLNPKLDVSTVEYGDDGRGHTYQTLKRIQAAYPDHEVVFIIGADKLSILPRWHYHDDLLREFSFGVAARNDADKTDVRNTIAANEKLSRFQDKFHMVPMVGDMSNVSSSKARSIICRKEWSKLDGILTKGTIDYLSNR